MTLHSDTLSLKQQFTGTHVAPLGNIITETTVREYTCRSTRTHYHRNNSPRVHMSLHSDTLSQKQQSSGTHVAPLGHIITETTVRGYTCRSTRTHYPYFEPTSLCSYSLILCAWQRSSKYQLYSLWFDTIETRTHVLPHSW